MEKVSIIVPVYKTEKYIERALKSLLAQTYSNLEIIVVDDKTPDQAISIVEDFRITDKRIQIIRQEINLGAYQTRINGMKVATGEYIVFLDSDDYMGIDFIRLLVKRSARMGADIVVGETIHQINNYDFYLPRHKEEFTNMPIRGKEIQERYFKQEGRCYSWHVIWNKLYKKDLIQKSLPYLEKGLGNLNMTEDIILSTVFLTQAKSVDYEPYAFYYYCRNEGSATNLEGMKFARFQKKFGDVQKVFDYIDGYLEDSKILSVYRENFKRFRALYARNWERISETVLDYPEKCKASLDLFCADRGFPSEEMDGYYDKGLSPYDSRLEKMKRIIVSDMYDIISFSNKKSPFMKDLYELASYKGKEIQYAGEDMDTYSEGYFLKNKQKADAEKKRILHLGFYFDKDYIFAGIAGIEAMYLPEEYMKQEKEMPMKKDFLFSHTKETKRIALWGTGAIAKEVQTFLGLESITLFIDNDRKKDGLMIEDKYIRHPTKIRNMNDYYIIIACAANKEVQVQLGKYDLKEFEHYISYDKIL